MNRTFLAGVVVCVPALAVSTFVVGCDADRPGAGRVIQAEQINGVRCRLLADKKLWPMHSSPKFKVHVPVKGSNDVWLETIAERGCRVEVDGLWFEWTSPVWTGSMMQTAGRKWLVEVGGYLAVTVDVRRLRGVVDRKPPKLEPGEHTVRFAWAGYKADPTGKTEREDNPILLVSNEVEITVAAASEAEQPPADDRPSEVAELFGSYVGKNPLTDAEQKAGLKTELRSFHGWQPRFQWQDIGTLLELGASDRPAGNIPSRTISSYGQGQCRQGMIALWLIEGLRRGQATGEQTSFGLYLPLNPMCVSEDLDLAECENSPKIHEKVLAAYKRWWSKVSTMAPEDAAMYDPLADAPVKWYGARSTGKPLEG